MFISKWGRSPVKFIAVCMLFVIQHLSVTTAYAQLISWDPSTLSGTFGPSPWTPAILASGLTTSGLVRGASIATSGTPAGGCWGGSGGWGTTDATTVTFTLTASCHVMSLTTFSGFTRRSGSGPTGADIYYSINGGPDVLINHWNTTSTSGTTGTANSSTLSTITALQNMPPGTIVKIRIAPNGGANNHYFTNNSLAVTGTMVAVTAPTITTSPSAVVIPATTGTSFTVSGVTGAASYQWQRNTSGTSGGTWVNITSATLDPTGTYSGYTTTSTATSNTLTLSNVPASWNGYGYRCIVTNCAGTATSGGALLNVTSSACSGIPTSGTAVATPSSFCASGASALSLSGSSTASGLTYQWISSTSSAAGPYTTIGSATSPTYNTPTLTTTTYYRCIVTCGATSTFDTSSVATVTINPLPTMSVNSGNVCSSGSGLVLTATGASTYSWAPSTGLSGTSGASVTANPTVTTTYTVTGTTAGCNNTATSTVTYVVTPGAVTVSPTSVVACAGDATRVLHASGGVTGPVSQVVNSGTITIPGSIAALGTITSSLVMSGIPAGATITGAAVNIASFGSNYQDDYVFNIAAPNGNILNLINQRGAHAPTTAAVIFTNTNVSSAGVTSLASGSGVFTGTWAADAAMPVSAAPYTSTVNTWSSLYSMPNGTWTLSIFNNTGFSNTLLTSAAWSITISYTYLSPITWSPVTNLYSDAAGTVPYVSLAVDSVFFKPTTAGSTTVVATATNGGCTRTASVAVTVNPLPGAITGPDTVCKAQTVTLSSTPTSGTWTASNGNVSFTPGTGDMTGVNPGTATVTYTLPTSCYITKTVTVNAPPAAITGPTNVCESATITLANTTTPGTWSADNSNVSVNAANGNITGSTAGSSTISYTLSTGCYSTYTVTVDQTPPAITGIDSVCVGSNVALSNSLTPGSWSSSNTNVTINASTGLMTGALAGTSTITYTVPTSCYATRTITVNSLPPAISAGTGHVCENNGTLPLSNSTGGGTWTSSNANISIDGTSGLVTGAAAGTSVVTYTLNTGCYITTIITIDAAPAIITGLTVICQNGTTSMLNATGTGTWSTASANISIGASSGIVTGINAGSGTISYTIPSGCYVTELISVNPLPSPITGLASVCYGSTIPLSSLPNGGTWTVNNANVSVSPIGDASGMTVGSSIVTYTLGTGCYITRGVSVDALPVAITGATSVCQGASATVINTGGGGTWTSGNTATATVNNATGVVTGGTAGTVNISYILTGTGCRTATTFTVHVTPGTTTGPLSICTGATATLSNSNGTGSWSSNAPGIASINSAGDVLGLLVGSAVISYILPVTGCYTISNVTVTATPSAITGSHELCIGASTPMDNPMSGGFWTSGNTAVGTVNSTSGVFTGITVGTASITYDLLTGCKISTTMTVNSLPPAITGTSTMCVGAGTMLMNAQAGGTWSVADPSIANVALTTGVVTGQIAGNTLISYTRGIGCTVTRSVSVHALPAPITGALSVCEGGTTTLSNTTPGGVWVSNNTTIANIGASTGIVNGVAHGITYITYTIGTTLCSSYATLTVNVLPAGIIGGNVCLGSSATFTDLSGGGSWSSSNTAVTTISGLGVAYGNALGTSTITYTFANGCYNTTTATVHPLPAAQTITGGGSYCTGLAGANIGLGSSESSVNYTLYTVGTVTATAAGTGSPVSFGLQAIPGVYTVHATNSVTGCQRNMPTTTFVAVQPLVTPSVTLTASTLTDASCSGVPVAFTPHPVNGGGSPIYRWYVNGVLMTIGGAYSLTPSNGDVINVRMNSNASCLTVDTAEAFNVRSVLPTAAPTVAFNLAPASTVCVGTVVTLTAMPGAGGASPSYVWRLNGAVAGTGPTYTLAPDNHDRVKCIITSNYMCRTADTAQSIEVELTTVVPTLPSVTINAAPSDHVNEGDWVTLTAIVTGAGLTPGYQWSVNGVNIPGATSSNYISNTFNNGDVVICLVTSSGLCNGITNYNSVVMTVYPKGPTGITQAGGTSAIRLIPNPNYGQFTISGIPANMAQDELTITITNMLGQRVYERTMDKGTANATIETDNSLANGMYIVNLRGNTMHQTMNFVIKR